MDIAKPQYPIEDLLRLTKILVVDDNLDFLKTVGQYLERRGLTVSMTGDPEEALALMKMSPFDILISDIRMPSMDGVSLAQEAKVHNPDISIILMTAYGTIKEALDAVRIHAFDFLLKPLRFEHLYTIIIKIIEQKTIVLENLLLRRELKNRGRLGDFVGISSAMQEIFEIIQKVSQKDTPILIEGESGTGKGLLASTIHESSPRRKAPFVEVNLAAVVPQLMESELFGHVKGAFTGAIRDNLGIILSAHGGTLFLDEIAEIAPELQVKLLRVLQERKVRHVGGDKEIPVDIRIIAATNRPLKQAVDQGTMREDFYYRIRVLPIYIPPLRERKEDIPALVAHTLRKLTNDGRSRISGLTPQAMNALLAHDWPGNVRELENLLERCAATCPSGNTLDLSDLPRELISTPFTPEPSFADTLNLSDLERAAIKKALEETNNNKKLAAQLLGIDKSTLHRKIKRYGIS